MTPPAKVILSQNNVLVLRFVGHSCFDTEAGKTQSGRSLCLVGVLLESRLLVLAGSRWYLLQLVVVDTHERNLCAAALVELVAARLAAESLEEQLPAEVTEGQREEGLPHLPGRQGQF